MVGLKSVKTIYTWIADGRLERAVRKRGKHNLILRDRAVEILFNGGVWTENGKNKKTNSIGHLVIIYPTREENSWTADFSKEGRHCRKSLRTRPSSAMLCDEQFNWRLDFSRGWTHQASRSKKKVSIQQATDDFLSNLKTDKRRKRTSSKYKGQFKKVHRICCNAGNSGHERSGSVFD